MSLDINGFLAMAAECLGSSGEDEPSGNIDQLCYCYAQFTGRPCPPPESFGAGDRSVQYTAASFAALANNGFGLDGTPSVPTGNSTPPPPSTGGQVTTPPPPSQQQPGGLFGGGGQNIGVLVGLGFLFWLLLSD